MHGPFPIVAGLPAFVDFATSVVDLQSLQAAAASAAASGKRSSLRDRAVALVRMTRPRNRTAERIAADLQRHLGGDRRVLVIGGGTVGSGLDRLYADPAIDIVALDVYPSANVSFVADAHRIPLADASMDAVIVQAVLEHVLEPAEVVAEIHRVLRPDGLVYADTPFMQQVHEGPYDFTRFTESGHRWLFRRFETIESGVVAGPGVQLAWSVTYAVRGATRSRIAGALCGAVLEPVGHALDRIVPREYAVDGASSVYFYGKRSERTLSPREIVDHYAGAQHRPKRTF